ncbi:FecR family protein [Acinetobacter puyangensis]|uniref:FecR family protein n=1 Tax=Acinetobacter puyangensis TaxID=1096779 RepID=UPI003A4D4061
MQDFEHSDDKTIILEQAADWLLLMEEPPLTPEQQQQFEQWKNTSPQHQKIWRRAEKIRQKLYGHAQHVPAALAKTILNQQDDDKPLIGKLVLLLAGSTVLGFSGYIAQQQAWFADHRTAYAEQQHITLEDGTSIALNSKTAIDVNYTTTERQIILRFGEIYVETGKDPAQRPFTVLNQHGEMLALGTAFNVDQQKDQTVLMVTEHAVQVTTDQSKQKQTIAAGQQIGFNSQHIYPTQAVQLEQLTWRKGLVTVNRLSLEDFAKIIEKNYGTTVEIDPHLLQATSEQIEISGSYPINNLDRLIVLLQSTYPVQIEKSFFGHKLVIKNR